MTEADVLKLVRLEGSRKGVTLLRNNVGATYDKTGRFIRYGLGHESADTNAKIKSADLIGIKPVLITPSMIGTVIGQFVSREVKQSAWKYRGNDRERAQQAWIDFINSKGGDAAFAVGEGTL